MIQFKKYNSIENTFDKEFAERIIQEGIDKKEFVVQKKVHGSNACFITDGKNACLSALKWTLFYNQKNVSRIYIHQFKGLARYLSVK